MKHIFNLRSSLVALISFILCSCCNSVSPSETLPAATQTGANTFGCLVNGKVWLPKGNVGTSNMSPSYDPNFNGKAIFDIATYRILSNTNQQYFGIAINGIDKEGTY